MLPETLRESFEALGVDEAADVEVVNRAFLRVSLALIQRGAGVEQREQLKVCHAAVVAYLEERRRAEVAESVVSGGGAPGAVPSRTGVEDDAVVARGDHAGMARISKVRTTSGADRSRWLEGIGAPVVVLLAIGIRMSPLGFLLQGFHVWIHEFGHATVAWLTGHRALPLPFGWTNIEPEKSLFVYVGVLFLLGVLGVAGWRERKPAAVATAIGLVGLQAYCTWVVPQHEVEKWIAFSGVGGEFYLSAAMMAAFWFHFPEKFRWEICRWLFLFIGAASFSQTFMFWRAVAAGRETIPWGSMVGGEDDASGDMDTLRDDVHWTEHQIVATYNSLGTACLVVLVACYVGAIGVKWADARRASKSN